MNPWKLYHVKRYFFISIFFLLIAYVLVGLGVWVYVLKQPERWFLYIIIVLGLYVLFSSYYLLYQVFFQFLSYRKKEGKVVKAKITYRYATLPDVSDRPLAEIETDGLIKDYLVIGLLGKKNTFQRVFKEGTSVNVFIMVDNEKEALLLSIDENKTK
jgi:amino acid transporter